MMVFAPYYDNAMLGGSEPGLVPVVNNDAGTPFTVIVIPVDDKLAIKPLQRGMRAASVPAALPPERLVLAFELVVEDRTRVARFATVQAIRGPRDRR